MYEMILDKNVFESKIGGNYSEFIVVLLKKLVVSSSLVAHSNLVVPVLQKPSGPANNIVNTLSRYKHASK